MGSVARSDRSLDEDADVLVDGSRDDADIDEDAADLNELVDGFDDDDDAKLVDGRLWITVFTVTRLLKSAGGAGRKATLAGLITGRYSFPLDIGWILGALYMFFCIFEASERVFWKSVFGGIPPIQIAFSIH